MSNDPDSGSARDVSETQNIPLRFFEDCPVAFYRIDFQPGPLMVYISPQIEPLTGYAPREWIETPDLWLSLVDPDDLPPLIAARDRAIAAGERLDLQYRLRARDGRRRWVRDQAYFKHNARGGLEHMFGVLIDITETVVADQAYRESEQKFRSIISNMQDGLAVVDADGRILEWNPAMERITGRSSADAVGRPVWEIVLSTMPPDLAALEDGNVLSEHIRGLTLNLLQSDANSDQQIGADTVWVHGGGSPRAVELSKFPIETAAGRMLAVAAREVTKRVRAEQALEKLNREMADRIDLQTAELTLSVRRLEKEVAQRRRAEQESRRSALRAETLAHASVRLNATLDLPDILNRVCQEAAQVTDLPAAGVLLYDEARRAFALASGFGYPPGMLENFTPLPINLLPPPIDSAPPLVIPDVLTRSDFPNRNLFEAFTVRTMAFVFLRHKTDLIGCLTLNSFGKPVSLTPDALELLQAFAGQTSAAIANARLYASVRQSRERLQIVSRRLIQVQEAERHSLAHELHDQIGQLLTGLQFGLERLRMSSPAELPERIDDSQALVVELLSQVRGLSLNLHPTILDDLGLLAALDWQISRYTPKTGVQVQLKAEGIGHRRFETAVETTAFRLVQEALTNIARHARTDFAEVRLNFTDGWLEVTIEDWGAGFELSDQVLSGKTSLGLAGMLERTNLIGGELTIRSSPGAGTRVRAVFPVEIAVERRKHGRYDPARG